MCRFDLLNIAGRGDQEEEKDYNIDLTDKSTKIIKIDLERKLNNVNLFQNILPTF